MLPSPLATVQTDFRRILMIDFELFARIKTITSKKD